jgi:hypothetical protein
MAGMAEAQTDEVIGDRESCRQYPQQSMSFRHAQTVTYLISKQV